MVEREYSKTSQSPPQSVSTSQEIRDRGSIFIANIFKATSVRQAKDAVCHLRNVSHGVQRATHEISAWRCMVLKSDKTGLGGEDDFKLASGYDDDGERYGGERILKVMKSLGIIDAVVVVSRWYGGILLGPPRFLHIETCTEEVCRRFKSKEEMEECIVTLTTLDDILSTLRVDYASLTADEDVAISSKQKRKPDYSSLATSTDLSKVRRLIVARENAIERVKQLIQKAREKTTGT